MALRRITKELKDIESNPVENWSACPTDDDLFKWNGTISGPSNTPYDCGIWFLDITFPQDYPFKPPRVKFVTKIFHPQINPNDGSMCLPMFGNNWSPALSISKVLTTLRNMLCQEPFTTPSECGCCGTWIDKVEAKQRFIQKQYEATSNEAWMMYFQDRVKYNKTANEWAVKYADAPQQSFLQNDKQNEHNKQVESKNNNTQQKAQKNVNENLLLEIINLQYGFEVSDIMDALDKTGNINANTAVEYLLKQTCHEITTEGINSMVEDNENKEIDDSAEKDYSLIFLKQFLNERCKRPEYLNNFISNGCDDIALLQYIGDEELQNDMKINKTFHRKIILKHIEDFKEEERVFKRWFDSTVFKSYDLKLLYKRVFEKNRIITWSLLDQIVKQNGHTLKALIHDDELRNYLMDQMKKVLNYYGSSHQQNETEYL